MKTKKLMKKNCSKNLRDCWHKNKLLFINLFRPYCHVKHGCRVHYGNVVVQQPLSASSVISAACISVAVVHICNKVVDSKVG